MERFGLMPKSSFEKDTSTLPIILGTKNNNNNKKDASYIYLKHFVAIFVVTFSVILLSITLGVFLGPPLSTGGTDLAMQVSISAVVHVFIFYVAFNTHTLNGPLKDIRVNPYMSLTDWLIEGRISSTLVVVELVSQALGAIVASSIFYAVVLNSVFSFVGSAGVTNASLVSGFIVEFISSILMGWVFFSNRAYENRIRMALSMAYIVGVTSGFVFPFIGLTTHSPFRWLASCVPSQSCGATGFWIFFAAPAAGIPLGNLLYKITTL